MKTCLNFWGSLVFMTTFFAVTGARATIIASDTFVGTDGSLLAGRTAETGGLTWAAGSTGTSSLVLSGNAVRNDFFESGKSTYADVPFNPTPYVSYAVSAQVDPVDSSSGWMAVGFRDATAPFHTTSYGLWALLRGSDTFYQLNKTGSGELTSGTIPVYNVGYNDVRLAYEATTTLVTLTINGNIIYNSPVAGLNPAAFQRAGFQFITQNTSGRLDNFQLEATLQPEPTTLGLLLVGAVLIGYRHSGKN